MNGVITSKGDLITGDKLQAACEAVAKQMELSAEKVRKGDAFIPHVTQAEKDDYINRFYTQEAKEIRAMENLHYFPRWQRINTELTGECVAFLPKTKEA